MDGPLWKDAQDSLHPHHDMPGTMSPAVGVAQAAAGPACLREETRDAHQFDCGPPGGATPGGTR